MEHLFISLRTLCHLLTAFGNHMTDHISGFPTLQGALCVVPDSEMTSSFVRAKVFSPVLKTFGAAKSDKEREKKNKQTSK